MTITPIDFDFLRELVYRRSGIVLDATKGYLVEQRLGDLARNTNHTDAASIVREARTRPGGTLESRIIEAMTTNETSFFRDSHPYQMLRDEVVPKLLATRGPSARLDIWSAACSTGQEPYSIAMSLADTRLGTTGFRIVATDLSTEVLDRARKGVFTQHEVNRGLPAPMLLKHFSRQGADYQVAERLRACIEFKVLNLIGPWQMRRMDIVFLRNVLIYFDLATKKEILRRVREILRPDGYLFLGGAETTLNVDSQFQVVNLGRVLSFRPVAA